MTALIDPLSRTTIYVRDFDRSLALYRDLLGLAVHFDVTIPNPAASQILNEHCDALRVIVLTAGGGDIGNIGLAQPICARPPLPHRPVPDRITFGETCLVIRTLHLKALLPKLRAHPGLHIVSEPTRIQRRDGGELWEIFFRDPDGVLVNLSHVGPWE